MKQLTLIAVLACLSGVAGAQALVNETPVNNVQGSVRTGEYLPGYPTAGVIFPRTQSVECDQKDGKFVNCAAPNWMPGMGRGEYLTFTPVPRSGPTVILKETHKETIREVPQKPGRE